MKKKLFKQLLLIQSTLLTLTSFGAYGNVDTTEVNHSVPGGYLVSQNCGSLTVSQPKAKAYPSPLKSQTNKSYKQGTKLWISEVKGDYAKIEYGSNETVWVERTQFEASDWARVTDQCEKEPMVDAPDNRAVYPSQGTRTETSGTLANRLGSPQSSLIGPLKRDYSKLKEFYEANQRKERYVLLNKINGSKFRTYVIDMQDGKIETSFDSLRGYNGIGCGKGQTRPGIFRLHSARGTGASRKPHWGNNFGYYVIQNIGGQSRHWGGQDCGVDPQIVAHSNINMSGADSNGERYSAGCFITSPQVFDEWTSKLAGNALIYNVKEPELAVPSV